MPFKVAPFLGTSLKFYVGKQEVDFIYLGKNHVYGDLPIPPLVAETASFVLTGHDVDFFLGYSLEMETESFVLTGHDVGMAVRIPLAKGAFALTGYDVTLTFDSGGTPLADIIWTTQVYAETIASIDAMFRATQVYAETIVTRPQLMKMTQIYCETIAEI